MRPNRRAARRTSPRWLTTGLGALLSGLIAVAAVNVAFGVADAQTSAVPVSIQGAGSWGPNWEMKSWQDALFGADQPIDMKYTAHGSVLGRQDFLAGNADFVISGRPFTADELAKLPNGGKDIIDAPIQVSTMAFLVAPPFPSGFIAFTQIDGCDPDDPPPPDFTCSKTVPYGGDTRPAFHGQLKVPYENLASMLTRNLGHCDPPAAPATDPNLPLNSWTCNTVLNAFGLSDNTTWQGMAAAAGPVPVLRSDPDEINYYLQQFVKDAAPNVWAGLKAEDTNIPWEPITERFARLAKVGSRDGAGQQAAMLKFPSQNPITGSFSSATAGIIAPVPPSAIAETATNPDVTYVEVKNANGDWVGPTPDTINAAVDAGGDTPLYALSHNVPNAYPFVWVDHMYVRTSGLTADKTEAIATTMRYLATAGQETIPKSVGEGRLPKALADQTIKAADQVVESNCPTKDGATIVKNSDPGSFAPKSDAMKAIGTMSHCVAPPDSSASTSNTPSVIPNTPLTPVASPPGVVTPTVVTPTTAAGDKALSSALITKKLVLPEPGGIGFDQVATLLLGALAFLLLRGPIMRLLTKSTT